MSAQILPFPPPPPSASASIASDFAKLRVVIAPYPTLIIEGPACAPDRSPRNIQ